MENLTETKQLITDAKNIYIMPLKSPEAITATMALFYTLKELGKNVNFFIDKFPEDLKFLLPSLDFISQPKNFVIAIPNSIANISQIFYEKDEQALKIHLTVEGGSLKKDNLSLYFAEAKPDLVITIGIDDYQEQLKNMDEFGSLLDSPILNISNKTDNKKFGKINIIEKKPLLETIMHLIKNLND